MTLRSILMRVKASLRRRSLDAALDEEVRGHLDLLARDYERRGLAPEQARLAARRDFGGVEQMKETYRDRSGLRWLDDARRDVHHAFRTLRRSPVFAGAAVLTLAVGLTAVTVIFAILNAFIFRPMPVSHPEELVSIGTGPDTHVQIPHGLSFRDLQDYRKDRTAFVDLLGYNVDVGGLTVDNTTERITMYSVTDNYFSLLGVQPAIGRLIQPNEGRARGDAPVLVLTHAYWLARFGGDPSVVGRPVRLNGKPFTIIGVTAQSFDKAHTLITPSAYMPLWMHDDLVDNAADDSTLEGRGKPSAVGARAAEARDLAVAGARLAAGDGGRARPGVSRDEQGLFAGRHSRDARPSEPEHRPLLSCRRDGLCRAGRAPAAHHQRQRHESADGSGCVTRARSVAACCARCRQRPACAPTVDRERRARLARQCGRDANRDTGFAQLRERNGRKHANRDAAAGLQSRLHVYWVSRCC